MVAVLRLRPSLDASDGWSGRRILAAIHPRRRLRVRVLRLPGDFALHPRCPGHPRRIGWKLDTGSWKLEAGSCKLLRRPRRLARNSAPLLYVRRAAVLACGLGVRGRAVRDGLAARPARVDA